MDVEKLVEKLKDLIAGGLREELKGLKITLEFVDKGLSSLEGEVLEDIFARLQSIEKRVFRIG